MISVKELVRQARVNGLQDVDADEYHYNDKAMIDAVNDTVQTALKLKPILRWTDTRTYKEPDAFIVNSIDDTLDIKAEYESSLMNGVCANICKRMQADEGMKQMMQVFEQEFVRELQI